MDTETHDYCLSQLELFYIFKDEDERKKCEDDIEFCYDTYMNNQEDINYVKRKSMPFMNYVEEMPSWERWPSSCPQFDLRAPYRHYRYIVFRNMRVGWYHLNWFGL